MLRSLGVFGFGLGEIVVIVLVALVVMGPKDLPKVLRKLGQWSGKLRRMAADLRAQSGIDDVLRSEGLAEDIAEIRKLARGEIADIKRSATVDLAGAATATATAAGTGERFDEFYVVRDREYPRDGADAYGALPDNAIVYAEALPRAPLARDPLYMTGDPDGVVPEPPPPQPEPEPEPEPDAETEPAPAVEPEPEPEPAPEGEPPATEAR